MNKYKQFSKVDEIHIDRICRSKVAFNSKEEAYQKGQDTYQCELCHKWHRTSIVKPKRGKLKGFTLG